MRHVDEGTIHAWLDNQITDPAEAAWLEEHLRWCEACASRLAEERATHEQAGALLSLAAPAVGTPAFDELVAKAANTVPETKATAVTQEERRSGVPGSQVAYRGSWLLQAGWAASLALAVGIGWMAREIADREPAQSSVAQEERRQGVPADREQSRAGVPGDQLIGERPREAAVNSADTVAAPPPVAAPSASTASASDVISRSRVEGAAAASRREPARSAPPQTPQQVANAVLPPSAPDAHVESVRGELERIAGAAASARQALAPPAAAPAAAPPPSSPALERVTTTSEAQARIVMTAIGWQTLPRTEAAARSGMPLYGIDGLEPTLTAISPDGRVVRTQYRLESGAAVELEQQRASINSTPAAGAQATRPALATEGRSGLADAVSAPPRIWSGIRGDVRLTLRSPSVSTDVDALGAKLRVD